ncbi:hypothetical protein ACFLT4_07840 [Chloroflexota bacterium]
MKYSYLFVVVVFIVTLVLSSCTQTPVPAITPKPVPTPHSTVPFSELPEEKKLNPAESIWAKIIPEKGTPTEYEIPLLLENTQEFINWYNSIGLSADEQMIRDTALSQLVAPCCDEYTIDTC